MFAIAQCIVVFTALRNGLGKVSEDVDDIQLAGRVSTFEKSLMGTANTSQLTFVSRALFLVSHYLAKLSVLCLLHRLFVRDQKHTALILRASIGFTTASGFASVFLAMLRCPSASFFVKHCYGHVRFLLQEGQNNTDTALGYSMELDHCARHCHRRVYSDPTFLHGLASSNESQRQASCRSSICLSTSVSVTFATTQDND